MSDVDVTVTDTEPDNPALDDIIAKALGGADDATPEPEAAAPEPAEDGRTRGPDGRFVKRETEAAQAEGGDKPAAEAQPPQPEAKPQEPSPAQAAWTDGHFAGWKPEQRQAFQSLAPDVQKLVMDRQTETQAFFQRKLAESDQFRRSFEPLGQAAQEVEPFARSIGIAPHDLLRNYAAIDQALRYAPFAEKVQLAAKLLADYGIPFSPPVADPMADPLSEHGQAYPVIHDLKAQLAQVQSQLRMYQDTQANFSQQQATSAVTEFASAKNADGSAKYPHFETVKPAMAQLLSSKQAATLEDAYRMAAKPIDDAIKAQVEARSKAFSVQQQEQVARAKKAAPIRASGSIPNGSAKGKNLDDILGASLDAHGFA